jgi:hypothetical protein
LKYWWYTADGKLYDPKGGENLAPRQQLREWKGSKSRSANSVAKAVREYRTKDPDRAVTVTLDGEYGWAVLAAGGSLPAVPRDVPVKLAAAVPHMRPFTEKGLPEGAYALADAGKDYLIWAPNGGEVVLDLGRYPGTFTASRLDAKSGKLAPPVEKLTGGQKVPWGTTGGGPAVLWVTRDLP